MKEDGGVWRNVKARERGKGNREEGTGKREQGRGKMRSSESAMANRTHRPRKGKAGNGKGRKDEVQSTKDEKGRSCGIEGVVSGQSRLRRISARRGGLRLQWSVECLAATRRGARSNCGMRNSEFGTRIRVVSRQYTDPTPYSASELRRSNRPG